MATVERTLVKSQPELWELLDQADRMQGWMSSLLGYAAEIEITEREPEEHLAWEGSLAEEAASIEIALAKKGWGTNVEIHAKRDGASPEKLEGWLEAIFDELASPQKRPFENI